MTASKTVDAATGLHHPLSVKVGPVAYRVTSDPDEWMRAEHDTQRSGYYGITRNTQAVIYLNPEADPAVTRLTLWHETLHALFEVTMGSPDWHGLGKTHNDREESVIRRLEGPTLTVLRDNPELVSYLTERD